MSRPIPRTLPSCVTTPWRPLISTFPLGRPPSRILQSRLLKTTTVLEKGVKKPSATETIPKKAPGTSSPSSRNDRENKTTEDSESKGKMEENSSTGQNNSSSPELAYMWPPIQEKQPKKKVHPLPKQAISSGKESPEPRKVTQLNKPMEQQQSNELLNLRGPVKPNPSSFDTVVAQYISRHSSSSPQSSNTFSTPTNPFQAPSEFESRYLPLLKRPLIHLLQTYRYARVRLGPMFWVLLVFGGFGFVGWFFTPSKAEKKRWKELQEAHNQVEAARASSTFAGRYSGYADKEDMKSIIQELKIALTGEGQVSTDLNDLERHSGDGIPGLGREVEVNGLGIGLDPNQRTLPEVVVWPESTAEVQTIMRIATRWKCPVTCYSGGTSVEGQTTPVYGGIVINISRMNRLLTISPSNPDCIVQPGISWMALNALLAPYKVFLPVDLSTGAHVGGMINTSASGTNAIKYGTMKDWVLNCTVVLANGEVVRTRSRAKKSSAGYDLTNLICGSEGTLGIITEVTLKLTALPEAELIGTVAFGSPSQVVSAVRSMVTANIDPTSLELLDTSCMNVINASLPPKTPSFPLRPHLFFKLSGTSASVNNSKKLLRTVAERYGGSGLRIAATKEEGEKLWSIRRSLLSNFLERIQDEKVEVFSTDVWVPLEKLSELVEYYNVKSTEPNGFEELGGRTMVFGHAGDGIFHSIISYDKDNSELVMLARDLERDLVAKAIALEGTSSGEHGIGTRKQEFLLQELDPTALHLMRSIKQVFDPLNLLNPGKLLPDSSNLMRERRTDLDVKKEIALEKALLRAQFEREKRSDT